MVPWDDAEEMGRSMIMKNLIGNNRDELCHKTYGKILSKGEKRTAHICILEKSFSSLCGE